MPGSRLQGDKTYHFFHANFEVIKRLFQIATKIIELFNLPLRHVKASIFIKFQSLFVCLYVRS